MNTNLMRFSGIASGMDTESMVKQMMQAKRVRVDRYSQQKTKNEWRQEAYHSVNKDMANFILESRKKLGLNKYSYTGKLNPGSIDQVDWAKTVKSSDDNALGVRASAKAINGNYKVKVLQLAEAAKVETTQSNLSMEEANEKFVKFRDSLLTDNKKSVDVSFKVSGKDVKVELNESDTMKSFFAKMRDKGVNIDFIDLGKNEAGNVSKLFLSTKETGKDASLEIKDVNFAGFLRELGAKVGYIERGPVIDTVNGKNAAIDFNGSIITNSSNNFNVAGISLDLKSVTLDENAPKIEISGEDYIKRQKALGELPSDGSKDSTINKTGKYEVPAYKDIDISVNVNEDEIFNKIKDFVEGYNKIIGELQDKLSEKEYKDYQPLTKEQKDALKEDDVKNWEEKAKSGLLNSNKTIRNMISGIRSDMYEKVDGADAMYNIGITTGSYKDGAKLKIDENKLRAAISKDAEGVLNTLFKSSDDTTNYDLSKVKDDPAAKADMLKKMKAQKMGNGAFIRIMDNMSQGMEEIVKEAGAGKDEALLRDVRGNIMINFVTKMSKQSVIDKDTMSIERRIFEENRRLDSYENMLWKRFTAMEKAIQNMQGQSGWLAQQFGGGQ